MICNIYPQEGHNDEAFILLDLDAAEALLKGLTTLIEAKKRDKETPEPMVSVDVFDSDGEGYPLTINIKESFVHCTPSYQRLDDWDD